MQGSDAPSTASLQDAHATQHKLPSAADAPAAIKQAVTEVCSHIPLLCSCQLSLIVTVVL